MIRLSTRLAAVVQFLLDHGADLDVKNALGQTPLAATLATPPRVTRAQPICFANRVR